MANSNNTSMQGTGAELGRINAEPLGTIVIEDDGDNDEFIRIKIEESGQWFKRMMMDIRQNQGDQVLMDMLDEIDTNDSKMSSGQPVDRSALGFTSGPFVCDDCSRTWPSKRNRTPNENENICPECYNE